MRTQFYYDRFLSNIRGFSRIVFILIIVSVSLLAVVEARAATYTVTNTNDSGAGSLRQAILDANATFEGDTIVFSIPGSGVKTITLFTILPISIDTHIDGWSQGGADYTGLPLIELRGTNLAPPAPPAPFHAVLRIFSNNSTVRGLVINGFNSTAFPIQYGLYIEGNNNTVQGCYIGTSADGNSAMGNKSGGIVIDGDNNLIGGTTTGARNVVSGNREGGIIIPAGSDNNRIEGNYVGLTAAGTQAGNVGNNGPGIIVEGMGNTIGGGTPEHRNIISGNNDNGGFQTGFGIHITGSNNNLQGNYIGTDATGNAAIGNRRYGIYISGGDNNLIGGAGPQFGNVISGNGATGGGPGGGIRLTTGADNNTVSFNRIGVGANGTAQLGNAGDGNGIWITGGNNNLIGGVIDLGVPVSAGNTIAYNYAEGVRVSDGSIFNKISRNSIFLNFREHGNHPGRGGIDLEPFNLSPNDSCDLDNGANNLQNFPVLNSAVSSSGSTTISGFLNSEPNRTYTIEFFSNDVCGIQGNGQGKTYLSSTTVMLGQFSCQQNFNVNFPATLAPGTIITATATDSNGNTSEFSACRVVTGSSIQFSATNYNVNENGGSATITVTRTGDASGTASVNYSTSNGTATAGQDYTATSGTLNFAANETSKTFNIPILDDQFYEGNETVNLTLSNVTGTVLGDPGTAVLTINDNETEPTISITDVSQNEGNTGTTNFTFTVNLSVASAQTVSVNYATEDGTATTANNDYQMTSATLIFTPNQTSKTFNVIVNGDTTPEPDESFFVNLTNPVNATTADNQGQGTIVNDDTCNNSINPTSINSSNGGGTGFVNVTSNCSWIAVTNADWITITSGSSGTGNGTVNYSVDINTGTQRTGTMTIAGQTFTVNQAAGVSNVRKPADFDGDSKTDISIFRPSLGQWWYQQSSNGSVPAYTFGTSTDKIVPGDYDGDGKTDIAFWRTSTAEWFVLRSSNLTFYAAPFGVSSDIPSPADFDGDGKFDFAVYRPSAGTWFILKSSDGSVQATTFGISGDIPQPMDYDGDGKADIAIYRPNGGSGNGEWWILRSTSGLFATPFGSATDKPVPGDYTGDGKADCAFFRPSTSEWFILRSEDLTFYAAPFGANGDIPVPGDYDGDGKFDLSVFRPSNVTWFVNKSSGGTIIQAFGSTGDIPVPSAYVP